MMRDGRSFDTDQTIVQSKLVPPHVATDEDRKEPPMSTWVIDASESDAEHTTYRLLDDDGTVTNVVAFDTVPEGGRVVAVWHPDGEDAAKSWLDEMQESEGLPPSEWAEGSE